MIHILLRGVDEFLGKHVETLITPQISKICHVENDEVLLTCLQSMIYHGGVDQTSYHMIVNFELEEKYREYEEQVVGSAEVRQLFKFSKVGIIAGSYILDGLVKSNSKARIIRDGVQVYDGSINSLQREKDSVKEVKKGFECGITVTNFNDIKVGDIFEAYEMVEKKRD